jgi:toxin CcdB
MAQFDVHLNPGRSKAAVPYLVVIQSAWFDAAPSRLVAPLLLAAAVNDLRPPPHMPRFEIDGRPMLLDPLQCQPVPRHLLGPPIASLADDNSAAAIVAAIDEIISRSHG